MIKNNTNLLHNIFINYCSDIFWLKFLAIFRVTHEFFLCVQLVCQLKVIIYCIK
jgi:hypothetical protein